MDVAHKDDLQSTLHDYGWTGDDMEHSDPFFTQGLGPPKSTKNTVVPPRCYTTHPGLLMPGTNLKIYGGNCSNPVVHDADIYIGLDHYMKTSSAAYPWTKEIEFIFSITDMQAPSNAEEFETLIHWIKARLDEGKKIHVGCIGGHGRTGTVFSALVSLYGEKNATVYTRNNYCNRAVESRAQVNFLKKNFGVTPTKGCKEGDSLAYKKYKPLPSSVKKDSYVTSFMHMDTGNNIWGE